MDNYQFPSIERVNEILDEIAEDLPIEFFKELNNGIILADETKYHEESKGPVELLIMGEYITQYTGKLIKIYYGSFKKKYSGYSESRIREELKSTLVHEFRHHIESRAGVMDLIIEDEKELEMYKGKNYYE